jgi:Glyoxalase-like domain
MMRPTPVLAPPPNPGDVGVAPGTGESAGVAMSHSMGGAYPRYQGRTPVLRIDHVVIAVRDLDAAGERLWSELGLGSVPGGRHPTWGTGNRIVPLGEEYVELLGVVDPQVAATSPVGTWIDRASRDGDRLVGWCVSTDDLDGIATRLGLAVTAGSRTLPDGRVLTWRSAGFDRVPEHPDLPFFITWDGSPDAHPGRTAADHRVQSVGITWIEVAGERQRLDSWLGDGQIPARVMQGTSAVRAVGIATSEGELVLT